MSETCRWQVKEMTMKSRVRWKIWMKKGKSARDPESCSSGSPASNKPETLNELCNVPFSGSAIATSTSAWRLNLIMRQLGQTIEDFNPLIFSSWFGGPPVVRQCPPASLYSWKLVHACILHCEDVPSDISIAYLREGAWRSP